MFQWTWHIFWRKKRKKFHFAPLKAEQGWWAGIGVGVSEKRERDSVQPKAEQGWWAGIGVERESVCVSAERRVRAGDAGVPASTRDRHGGCYHLSIDETANQCLLATRVEA